MTFRISRAVGLVIGFIVSLFVFTAPTEAAVTINKSILPQPPNSLGLQLLQTFDGSKLTSTTTLDSISAAKNGAISGAVPTRGKIGQALRFDGTDDAVVVSEQPVVTTPSVTASAWIKMTAASIPDLNHIVDGDGYTLRINDGTFFAAFQVGAVTSEGSTALNDGLWHHVVGTYDNANVRLYVDGVQVDSDAQTGDMATFGNPFLIGKRGNNSRWFTGDMDDIRVYNRPLSAAEVAQLYRSGTATANKSSAGPASSNLLLWQTFDGPKLTSTTTIDSVTSSNNGSLAGATPVSGRIGQALDFDGSDDAITLSNSVADLSNISFSIAFWVKTTSQDHNKSIYSKTGADSFIGVATRDNGGNANAIRFFLRNSTGAQTLTETEIDTIINDGSWHHVVAIYDSTGPTMTTYVDGVSRATGSPAGGDYDAAVASHYIGQSDGGGHFPGTIDDFRIYNRALSASEVLQLSTLGFANINRSTAIAASSNLLFWQTFDGPKLSTTQSTDRGSQGNTGTLMGSPGPVPIIGKIGQALDFNGANYIEFEDSLNQGTGSYTFSSWIKPSSISGCDNNGDGCNIINQYEGAEGDFYIGVASTGAITAVFRESGGSTGRKIDLNAAQAVTIAPDSWYHIAATRVGTTYAVYINGVAQTLDTFLVGSGSGGTRVGASLTSDPVYMFRGIIDDVRVYTKAFSASEVLQLYNSTK